MSMSHEHSDDNSIDLFTNEEQDYLDVQLDEQQQRLRLQQYNSSHEQWGIYSTVWEGGLGLIKYLHSLCRHCRFSPNDTTLIDVGSGTGVVGLAMANAVSRVYLTDLPEAMPLLKANVKLNEHIYNNNNGPQCKVLAWGDDDLLTCQWLQSMISETTTSNNSNKDNVINSSSSNNYIITGADIVYRQSLFEPLIKTIIDLTTLLSRNNNNNNNNDSMDVEVKLSCNSCRTHLREFWQSCTQHGIQVKLVAVVDLHGTDLSLAELLEIDDGDKTESFDAYPAKDGRMYIVQLCYEYNDPVLPHGSIQHT